MHSEVKQTDLKLDSLDDVIKDVGLGKLVVMVDDESRENEGDLIIAAEKVTAEAINFMLQEGKGLICLSLSEEKRQQLSLDIQVTENTAAFGTNFTVSIDHKSVVPYGVTASARAKTILAAASDDADAQDFVTPGYVFPLAAKAGGVLKRRGQTEGSVDISRIAGLKPAAVICEIMGEDGTMLAGDRLEAFCKKHELKITSVDALAKYRLKAESSIRRTAKACIKDLKDRGIDLDETLLKGSEADFCLYVYTDDIDNKEHLAIVVGKPKPGCLVRIHSECLTGDVFGSRRCDCGLQLSSSLSKILEAKEGIVVYLSQEGRGIGLANKLRAYELQDQGLDTVEANLELGFSADYRDYRVGAQILLDLGVGSIRLMTNNPNKLLGLEDHGIRVLERLELRVPHDELTEPYLATKRDRMGHMFPGRLSHQD